MRLHPFNQRELTASRWRNGGGSTREIACWPPGSDAGAFDWRLSIATIAASGPFSRFDGVDRVIVLLAGAGVRLHGSDSRIDHRLDALWQPFAFPGEAEIQCEMLGEESRDFNVMARRGVFAAEVSVLREEHMVPASPFGMLLALRGAWRAVNADRACTLEPGSGLWWERGAENWVLALDSPRVDGDDPALLVVNLQPSAAHLQARQEET